MGPQLVFDLRLLESRLNAILGHNEELITMDELLEEVERVRNLTRAMINGYETEQLPENLDLPRFPFPA